MSADHPASPIRAATRGDADARVDAAALLPLLLDWLPTQRWFADSADAASGMTMFRRERVFTADHLRLDWVLLHAPADRPDTMYQVLIGWRTDVPAKVEHAIIGVVGDQICYDALYDRDATDVLLRALAGEIGLGAITAHRAADAVIDTGAHGLVMTAEQSNTSVVYGDRIIAKFFRHLSAGVNPDAEVLAALTHSGHTPDLIGEFRIAMTVDAAPVTMTLAVATQYLANSADGWSMATASVRDLIAEGDLHADEVGGDFAAEAMRLGQVIAHVHHDLADAFGTKVRADDDRTALFAALAARAAEFAANVPGVASRVDAIRDAYRRLAAAAKTDPLTVQRIHGDLHLGQVLRTVDGWVVVDFEGEPLRDQSERRRLVSPLMDVAGMLRSFDYAAHQLLVAGGSDTQRAYRASEWALRNRNAFLDGYTAASGADPRAHPALLAAFELDKAIYEAGYEHRHRPAWEQIPLAAVDALTAPD